MKKILLIALCLLIPSLAFGAYPTNLDSFSTKGSGDTIVEGDVNEMHTPIVQVETKIGTGTSAPTDATVLCGNGAGTSAWTATLPAVNGSALTNLPSQNVYIKVSDVKAQNTAGGTFTNNAWRTRDINTEDIDTGNNCAVAANQITLSAGTYECYIRCPAYNVEHHQARLYNTTGAALILLGTTAYTQVSYGGISESVIIGRFTVAAAQVLEIQHYCIDTATTAGFGVPANIGSEVYTIAEFRKVA